MFCSVPVSPSPCFGPIGVGHYRGKHSVNRWAFLPSINRPALTGIVIMVYYSRPRG